ncbi:PH domain-containing protein [Streptomyces sp. NPDC000229]|uniref:PH domain-containing protein n=1 Tax=Streptomyces sp. NPDC000229 TaxID=3154247 RepID=UPI003331D8A5
MTDVDLDADAHTDADSVPLEAAGGEGTADGSDQPWERLHPRLIWVNLGRLVLSLVPTGLSFLVFGTGDDPMQNWPAMVATAIGLSISVGDVVRWIRTRYRITEDLVEIRTGRIVRVYRQVPRDRIRTVDVKSRLRHRLAGLRVVFISSGRTRPAIKLDAVSKQMALTLQRELMYGRESEAEEAEKQKARETPIAEFRWYWIFYNAINIWGVLVGGLMLWSLDSMTAIAGFDLIGRLGDLIDGREARAVPAWVYWGLVVTVLGHFVLVTGFLKDNWLFQLVRVHKDDGTALLTRHGMFSTREVHRDDRRLRGIHTSEPLFWRWMGLTETTVLSTGLATFSLSGEPAASILPRAPIREARRAAAMVLPGPERPLEAPLRRHPRAALVRRLVWAFWTVVPLAGLLYWLGATDVVPGRAWTVPLWLTPVAALLALPAYKALGHALVGRYLVLRCGVSRRQTTALRKDAVIGVKMRQSLLQRRLGLVTMGVSTAVGERFYCAPDMGTDQFLAFLSETAPELTDEFVAKA